MVNNKRGWLRIVEASISIVLVLGVILVMNIREKETYPDDPSFMLEPLLEELAKNVSWRELALNQSLSAAEVAAQKFFIERINNPAFNLDVRICQANEVCMFSPPANLKGDIFSSERIIGANPYNFTPKKIKVFLWRIR